MYPIECPTRRGLALAALASGLLATFASPSRAYELNDRVSLGAVLAAAGQCQEGLGGSVDADGQERAENSCRGGMPFQLALDVRPSARDELYVLLGFAVDDGLNAVSPFVLALTADIQYMADAYDSGEDIDG